MLTATKALQKVEEKLAWHLHLHQGLSNSTGLAQVRLPPTSHALSPFVIQWQPFSNISNMASKNKGAAENVGFAKLQIS